MTRTRRRRRGGRGRGFTLTELMVVVAIIGVLVGLAIVYMRPKIKPIDVSNRLGDLVREGARRAVALGPVPARVATAVVSGKARTRIITSGPSSPQPTFVLERLQEDPEPATTAGWVAIQSYTVPDTVIAESWGVGVGPRAGMARDTDWATLEILCYPDGTCIAHSLFFEATTPGRPEDNQSRISIMPLGGAIMTRPDWN